MPKLEGLVVDLEVNSAKLRQGLDQANAHLKGFGANVKEMAEGIHSLSENAAVEFGKELVEGLAEFVMKGSEAADKMGKLAQAAGVPVETLSRLDYAAKLSGLSTEELGGALNKLNKNIGQAGAGASEASAKFSAIGVAVKDSEGKVRGSDAILGDLAEKFAGMEDGASKSALAMEFFGKSGAQLIPFLNRGRDGIGELSAEADRLGITLSDKAVKATTEFNDDIIKLKSALTAVAEKVAADLAPTMTKLADELLKSKAGADLMHGAVIVLAGGLRIVATAGLLAYGILEEIAIYWAGIASAVVSVLSGDLKGAVEGAKGTLDAMKKSAEDSARRIADVWKTAGEGASEESKKHAEGVKKDAADVVAALERQKKAAEDYKSALKTITKEIDTLTAKNAAIGQGPDAELINRVTGGDLAKEFTKLGERVGDALRERILRLIDESREKLNAIAKGESDFQLGRKFNDLDSGASQRDRSFGNIGLSVPDVFKKLTAGFESFDAALAAYVENTKARDAELAVAATARANGDIVGAHQAEVMADNFGRAASGADRAAKAFEESAARTVQANKAYEETMHEVAVDAEKLSKDIAKQRIASAGSFMPSFGGFKDVDAALEAFQKSTRQAAELTAEAARLSALGFADLANDTKDLARSFTNSAQSAQEAADKMKEFGNRVEGMQTGAINHVLSKLGEAGGIMQGAIGAYQQAGGGLLGIIAAFVSAIIDIISGFSAFTKMVDDLNSTISKLRDDLKEGIGSILDAFVEIGEAGRPIANVIHEILNPILKEIGHVLYEFGKALGPALKGIGAALGPIVTIINVIIQISNAITPLVPIMKIIGNALTWVGLTILGTVNGVEVVWQKILEAIRDVWSFLGGDTSGIDQTIKDNQANIDKIQKQLTDLWNSQQDPFATDTGTTLDDGTGNVVPPEVPAATAGIGDLGDAAQKAADQMVKLNEQLTNVPAGFKIQERRFQAMAAQLVGPSAAALAATGAQDPYSRGGRTGASAGAGGASGASATHTTVHVNGAVTGTPTMLANIISRIQKQQAFRRGGA